MSHKAARSSRWAKDKIAGKLSGFSLKHKRCVCPAPVPWACVPLTPASFGRLAGKKGRRAVLKRRASPRSEDLSGPRFPLPPPPLLYPLSSRSSHTTCATARRRPYLMPTRHCTARVGSLSVIVVQVVCAPALPHASSLPSLACSPAPHPTFAASAHASSLCRTTRTWRGGGFVSDGRRRYDARAARGEGAHVDAVDGLAVLADRDGLDIKTGERVPAEAQSDLVSARAVARKGAEEGTHR